MIEQTSCLAMAYLVVYEVKVWEELLNCSTSDDNCGKLMQNITS